LKIANVADLKNLYKVSKNICEVVTPYLYKSLTFDIKERSLEDLTHYYKGLPLEQVERYTKDILIRVPFYKRIRNYY
jgi:hypothetical protein